LSFIISIVVCAYCEIQLLADLNLKKTPQLEELFDDSRELHAFYHSILSAQHIFLRKNHFAVYCLGYR
jgi:hypothetical protein